MQLNSNDISYKVGSEDIINQMSGLPSFQIFDDRVTGFLDKISKILLNNQDAKKFPDVITFAFWCRQANLRTLQKSYATSINRIGRGVVFHIAPSNVPVNFAYSLVVGLLAGNGNIVRLPSKNFEQVHLICSAISEAFTQNMEKYIACIQYGHNQEITDSLSLICDTRIIWGGDGTIGAIRKSRLAPRATEITFADRYSVCVIHGDRYLEAKNKEGIALGFYNDTYLSDQNACTSPRIIIWIGENIHEAQDIFWNGLRDIVKQKYIMEPVKVVGKYSNLLKQAVDSQLIHLHESEDNYIMRVKVDKLSDELMEYKGNCGYFMEYTAKDLKEILPLCTKRCQTISYFGIDKNEIVDSIMEHGVKGVDRIVPIGKTMDFMLIWDGYDLINSLSRQVVVL